ncbi:MAG: mechanosensitive ion channel family protein [Pseudoxanthomonas sp.]
MRGLPTAAWTPVAAVTADPADALNRLQHIDWWQFLEQWGLKLLAAAVIFLAGRWLARWLTGALERLLGRAKVDSTLTGFLHNVTYATLLVLVVMTSLSALSVPTTSMFAVLGAAGLAVGLALKDSLSNIASGVMLIVLRPFRDGDYVLAGGQEGTVEEIRIFQTRLRTADNRVVMLPNSLVTAAAIINTTAHTQRRIDVSVNIGLGDDLGRARALLLEAAGAAEKVLAEPAPLVQVGDLGESSIKLNLFAWSATSDYGAARSNLLEAVRTRLTGQGIAVPVPTLHVYPHPAESSPSPPGSGC